MASWILRESKRERVSVRRGDERKGARKKTREKVSRGRRGGRERGLDEPSRVLVHLS